MRYFWTLFWSLLLSNMIFYVLSSMNGSHFDAAKALIFGVIFTVVISILGAMVTSHHDEISE